MKLTRELALGLLAVGSMAFLALAPGRTSTAQTPDAATAARAYLADNAAGLGLPAGLADLTVEGVREGLTGRHVRYQQTANGAPVFGAYVTVDLPDGEGGAPRVLSRYVAGDVPPPPRVGVGPAQAMAAAFDATGPGAVDSVALGGLVYYPLAKNDMRLAWQVYTATASPPGDWLTLVDAATGETLYRNNRITLDSGQVFDPNPAQTHGGTAAIANCDQAGYEPLLAPQYRTKTLLGIEAGQGQLKGEFVDLTAPGIDGAYKPAGLADDPSHDYVYGCSDDRFEEVMAYYHVDATQRKVQSLGFTGQSGVLARPIGVHAHYYADCNAFFDPFDGGLHFGDSADPLNCGALKTDTAEDGDIIVHEYGHALQEALVPGWANGPYPQAEQARSMGEGFGDFMAAAMAGDPCMSEYANFGGYECGGKPGLRWLQADNTYPSDFEACPDVDMNGDGVPESEEEHCGGKVWGGALWDLAENLGNGSATPAAIDTALRLVIEAHFYLDPLSGFDEAAAAVCMVDGLLNQGANADAIASAFAGRGISTGTCISDDYMYLNIRVVHPFSGDLDINVLVGADHSDPVCSFDLADPLPWLFFPNLYIGAVVLDASTCWDFLPPAASQPWWLEVRDASPDNTGSIEAFDVLLYGGSRCVTPDVPVAIPDAGDAVYAMVDCSVETGPPGPTPNLPTPARPPLAHGDVDCDGDVDSVDSLMVLRHVAGLALTQQPPCPDIGTAAAEPPAVFGDVDCDGDVDSVDALLVLRHVAGLPAGLPADCPPVGPATPTPLPTLPPAPTPPGTATPLPTPVPALVTLRHTGWHVDASGMALAAGEVLNESDRPVGLVRVEASFYSASGELLKTSAGYSCLMTIPPGGDSPYEILVYPTPAGIDHVEFNVAKFFDPPFIPAAEGLQGQVTNMYTDFISYVHAAGTMTNTSSNSYKQVKGCVAFYNEQGDVVRSKFVYTSPNVLGPGGVASFDTSIKPDGIVITGARVWGDATAQ